MRTRLLAVVLLSLTATAARADVKAEKVDEVPSVYVLALPTMLSLVAYLPVDGAVDLFDLDVRVEVVMSQDCGDKVAGLMRRGGVRAEADTWDVVLTRKPPAECKEKPVRINARWALRFRVPDGATRDLVIGSQTLKVARAGAALTLDGQPPTGDVPGAPPTDRPRSFITGEVTTASLVSARPATGGLRGAVADVKVTARWPRCAGPLLGLLGSGDLASQFMLVNFKPIALAPQDGTCAAALLPRTERGRMLVRQHTEASYDFTVGAIALKAPHEKAPPAAAIK